MLKPAPGVKGPPPSGTKEELVAWAHLGVWPWGGQGGQAPILALLSTLAMCRGCPWTHPASSFPTLTVNHRGPALGGPLGAEGSGTPLIPPRPGQVVGLPQGCLR